MKSCATVTFSLLILQHKLAAKLDLIQIHMKVDRQCSVVYSQGGAEPLPCCCFSAFCFFISSTLRRKASIFFFTSSTCYKHLPVTVARAYSVSVCRL